MRVAQLWAAYRAEYVLTRSRGRNPFDFVDPYDVEPAERCLDDSEVAAVGRALREAEALAAVSSPLSRHTPSLTALRPKGRHLHGMSAPR
jgi:hypothetical protein